MVRMMLQTARILTTMDKTFFIDCKSSPRSNPSDMELSPIQDRLIILSSPWSSFGHGPGRTSSSLGNDEITDQIPASTIPFARFSPVLLCLSLVRRVWDGKGAYLLCRALSGAEQVSCSLEPCEALITE